MRWSAPFVSGRNILLSTLGLVCPAMTGASLHCCSAVLLLLLLCRPVRWRPRTLRGIDLTLDGIKLGLLGGIGS